MKTKTLISVVGPTAVGKTKFAVELAQTHQTEIISCDSRQFFKELVIGAAIPTSEEKKGILHHFISNKSISESYNVGDYQKEASELLKKLFEKYEVVILVGGSGLYEKAITEGLDDLPVIPSEIRQKLNQNLEEFGVGFLQRLLQEKDPKYFNKVDIHNPHRLIRALEILEYTGKSILDFQQKKSNDKKFTLQRIGLSMEREKLYERINTRVEQMIQKGLRQEVESLVEYKNHQALKTVGYTELFQFLDGMLSLEQAVEEIKKNSRRYAKRQLTWFKKLESTTWINL